MGFNLGLLEIKKSKIRNAGIGCFARTTIPAGTIIGPYEGRYMTMKQRSRVKDGTYIWKINDNLFVDGKNSTKNNPLRYVNGAKTKLQQSKINCEVRFLGKNPYTKVYYMTTKNILPGDELIISYGNNYFI